MINAKELLGERMKVVAIGNMEVYVETIDMETNISTSIDVREFQMAPPIGSIVRYDSDMGFGIESIIPTDSECVNGVCPIR